MANRFEKKITDSIKNAEEAVEEAAEDSSESLTHRVHEMFRRRRQSAFQQFPATFTLLGTIGIVAVFYGTKHLLDQVSYFANNPTMVLVLGVTILLLTGRLQREIDEG